MRRLLIALVGLLLAMSCGPLPTATPAVTAKTVAVQPSDVPTQRQCDISGDMEAYLTKVQAKDPTHYAEIKKEWDDAKAQGATNGQVAVFTDSDAHCATFQTNNSNVTAAQYKLVVNFVVQFKDEPTAKSSYTGGSIMGFSPSKFKSQGLPIIEGDSTGLGANSTVVTLAVAAQSFYIAVWQNKKFMVILAVLNIDNAAAKTVAKAENSRIS
jgi:hypothetical protein